jgi:S-adenosylmethionine decarboxylase
MSGTICSDGHFGEHFMIDGYGCCPAKLADREAVFLCLDRLPEKLGMQKLLPPIVLYAPPREHGKDDGGWTGVVVIQESHISIHTFPKVGFVSIDVYTCQNGIDIGMIRQYFIDAFGILVVEEYFVKRGKWYAKMCGVAHK